jgi:hypothetical protein
MSTLLARTVAGKSGVVDDPITLSPLPLLSFPLARISTCRRGRLVTFATAPMPFSLLYVSQRAGTSMLWPLALSASHGLSLAEGIVESGVLL